MIPQPETQMYQQVLPFRIKKKKINGNTAGCLPGLRGNDNSGGTAASRTTHLLLFSFRINKTMFAKYETGTPGDGKYFSCFE